mgnify:CR=1 FL=1
MDPATRAALEGLYAALLSAGVLLARALGKPCPVVTREERRQARAIESSSCETSQVMVK